MTKLQSSTILITRLREKYKNTNKIKLKLDGGATCSWTNTFLMLLVLVGDNNLMRLHLFNLPINSKKINFKFIVFIVFV